MNTRTKVVFLIACLIGLVIAVEAQRPVAIPADCAQSCPPNGQKLCAKNTVTKQVGTFDSDCVFGRYNSCIKTTEKYEFIKYGDC